LTDQDLETNRRKSSIRLRAEHIFGTVKGFLGFKTVRYRGLAKNENCLDVLFALSNLSMSRSGLRDHHSTDELALSQNFWCFILYG
jgi:IS5 family transposase